MYEDGDTHGSWVLRGVDAFYLSPAKDHYQCNNYYIPETRAYRISGSTKLFPQHCQLSCMTPHQRLRALTDELTNHTAQAIGTPKGRCLLKHLAIRINKLLHLPPISDKQRVNKVPQREARKAELRVIDKSPIFTVPCITDPPPPSC